MKNEYVLEKKVKQKINKFLNEKVDCFHFPYSAFGGRPGIPDKILIQDGRFISIESKKTPIEPGMKIIEPTPVQKVIHKIIKQFGGIVILINECDYMSQLKKEFDNYGIKYKK